MKQIWRIYKTDLRNVAKHWAAIVIVLGLMILPSLYAWFNIKASWDPYGNTKEVPIAVSNQDAGSNLRGKILISGKRLSLKKNKILAGNLWMKNKQFTELSVGIIMQVLRFQKTSLKKSQLFWMKIRKTRTGLLCE